MVSRLEVLGVAAGDAYTNIPYATGISATEVKCRLPPARSRRDGKTNHRLTVAGRAMQASMGELKIKSDPRRALRASWPSKGEQGNPSGSFPAGL